MTCTPPHDYSGRPSFLNRTVHADAALLSDQICALPVSGAVSSIAVAKDPGVLLATAQADEDPPKPTTGVRAAAVQKSRFPTPWWMGNRNVACSALGVRHSAPERYCGTDPQVAVIVAVHGKLARVPHGHEHSATDFLAQPNSERD